MQRSIGVCFCWADLETRRKAIDLFVQRQLEVIDGIPKKVFYECGATPISCKYNVTAVRSESTGHFELFEMGEHSHPIRANISSCFLVDQINSSCPQSVSQPITSKNMGISSSDGSSKILIQNKNQTMKKPSDSVPLNRKPSKANAVSPLKKVWKLTSNKKRDSSNESIQTETNSATSSCIFDDRWKSLRKMPPRAVKMNSDANKQASLTFLNNKSPCERLTRLRARTLLDNNSTNNKPQASRKTIVTTKNSIEYNSKTMSRRKRCISSSSSSSTKSQSKNVTEDESGSSSEYMSNISENKTTFRSRRGVVWNKIATIFGDAALSKFQQANHMKGYKHLIWRCNLMELRNEAKNECPYRMRVCQQKKGTTSNVYYIYFSGVHGPSCKKYRHELESKNNNNFKRTASIGNSDKSKDKKQTQINEKRDAAVKSSRKISDQIQKKIARKATSLIGFDSRKSKDNEEKIESSSENTATDEVATLSIEHRYKNPTSNDNSLRAHNSLPRGQESNDESILLIQSTTASNDLTSKITHLITSTPISSIVPTSNSIDGKQNANLSLTPIRLNSAPIILSHSEIPSSNKSLGIEKATETSINLETSPMFDLPKDWHFKLENLSSQLKQLSEELRLKFTRKGSNLAVFSSKEQSQTGQVLVLADQLDDDIFVKVSEYGGWKLISEEMWPKASIRPFLYAVRGKLIEFFFVIPNESMSPSSETNGKLLVSEFNSGGATTTSSSVQVKRELDDDGSTIISSGISEIT